MAAGFNTVYQPQIQPQYQGYSQNYGVPQPAIQSYTQAYTQNHIPAQFQPQNYPQNYYLPQTPGIINYLNPPAPNVQNTVQNPQPQTTNALSSIPYEQNPLNMNTEMNAQMPAPNVQQGQNGQQINAVNNEQQTQPYMDIGVVDAPQNFSKTPIIDDLNRRGQETPKETPPKLRGKKTLTSGNISAILSMGSLGIILTMALCKIVKLIKHK